MKLIRLKKRNSNRESINNYDNSDDDVILYDDDVVEDSHQTVFVLGEDIAPPKEYMLKGGGNVLHRQGQSCTSVHARATKMKRRRQKTILIIPTIDQKIKKCGICNRTK